MRLWFFLFLTVIQSGFAFSQDTRIEIKLSRVPKDVSIISLQQDGFLLKYSGGEKRGNSFNSFNITKLNSNFEEIWNKLLDIPSRFKVEYQLVDSISQRIIWMSQSATQLRLDILNLDSGKNSTQTYNLARNLKSINSAILLSDNLIILSQSGPDEQLDGCYNACCFPLAIPLRSAGLTVFNHGNIYTKVDLKNQIKYDRIDVLKGIYFPDKIQLNTINKQIISISSYKSKPHSHGSTAIEIKNINQNLKTTDSFEIESPKNVYLQNIQWLNSNYNAVGMGTFNNQAPQPSENLNTIEAQGFYTVVLDSNHKTNTIKLFKFNELKSFNSFIEFSSNQTVLSENRKERLKRRYKNYSTLIRVNEITERENDFLATAEAFYAVYSSYRDANGNLVQYFEGYNYTHFILICFDKNGNLKWDKTLPLNFNRLYLNLDQKVKCLQTNNLLKLMYGSIGTINVITINGDTLSGPKIYQLPRLIKEDEKVNEYLIDSSPWYSNKCLIWGVQKIKKSDQKEREGNTVIYIDELKVE